MVLRVGEEQLVAVRIFDDHRVITPPAILDRRTAALEFCPERLQRFDVYGDEDAALPVFLGLLAIEEDFAILAVDLSDEDLPILFVAGGFGEAELFGIERDGPLYTFDEENWTRIPDAHSMDPPTASMVIIVD